MADHDDNDIESETKRIMEAWTIEDIRNKGIQCLPKHLYELAKECFKD